MAKNGFTLIELMMVSAIIGMLAAIALPKFANLVLRSKEAAAKGALGSLRSAMTLYYADNEGLYPAPMGGGLNLLSAGGKYMQSFPDFSIPLAANSHQAFALGPWYLSNGTDDAVAVLGYVVTYPISGHLRFNCTHMDSKENIWSRY